VTTANVRPSYSGRTSAFEQSELDMSFSEQSKIAATSRSRRVDMPVRRIGFLSMSARLPVANISMRPNHPIAIPRIRGGLSPKTLRRVQDHIAANLGQKITNEALAQVANLSPSHFARAFKDSQGVAPHRYILECRVERTQELLATELSLSEIAVEVGFADQSHLTRWFREFVGVTPGGYRWSIR
jgi:transcriptional regulator GlxA family with amidase domain